MLLNLGHLKVVLVNCVKCIFRDWDISMLSNELHCLGSVPLSLFSVGILFVCALLLPCVCPLLVSLFTELVGVM